VAFIDNDEVEKLRRVGLEETRSPLVLGQRLIDREIHLAALHHLAGLDLVPGILRREVLG
jgi:hypothetical protein